MKDQRSPARQHDPDPPQDWLLPWHKLALRLCVVLPLALIGIAFYVLRHDQIFGQLGMAFLLPAVGLPLAAAWAIWRRTRGAAAMPWRAVGLAALVGLALHLMRYSVVPTGASTAFRHDRWTGETCFVVASKVACPSEPEGSVNSFDVAPKSARPHPGSTPWQNDPIVPTR